MNTNVSVLRDLILDQRFLVAAGLLIREEEEGDFQILLGYLEAHMKEVLSEQHWTSLADILEEPDYLIEWTEAQLNELEPLFVLEPAEVAECFTTREMSERLQSEADNLMMIIGDAQYRAYYLSDEETTVEPDFVPFFTFIRAAAEKNYDCSFEESYEGEFESERDYAEYIENGYGEAWPDGLDALEESLFGNNWLHGTHELVISYDNRSIVFRKEC